MKDELKNNSEIYKSRINRICDNIKKIKEHIIVVIVVTILVPLVANIIVPILTDAEEYAKKYNSYVYRVHYEKGIDLDEQVDSIKKELNIEDRIETVMISPSESNNVIMVVFSDSNIHNLGFYDFDTERQMKYGENMNKYLKGYKDNISKDGGVLCEKLTPNEVFMLVAPEGEAMPTNYLLWESPTYEMATSVLEYNGRGEVSVNVRDSEYTVHSNAGYESRGGLNTINYKKTGKSIGYHIMNNFNL